MEGTVGKEHDIGLRKWHWTDICPPLSDALCL